MGGGEVRKIENSPFPQMNEYLFIFVEDYVHYHFNCSRMNKRGVGTRMGGFDNFSKITKRGRRLFSTLE